MNAVEAMAVPLMKRLLEIVDDEMLEALSLDACVFM